MSKEAALRAMREARYLERTAGGTPATRTPRPAVRSADTKDAQAVPVAPEATDGLCGHRSMNGRTCTRESGHAAKSHRYS
jgi:hypothetical protein